MRRNELSDFASINRNGKIAMKLEAGDGIVGVQVCTDQDDVLLTTRGGKCIRFSVTDVRVFKGRESTGVRGIKLAAGDEVVSLSLLHHSDATTAEARAYLKQASAARRAHRARKRPAKMSWKRSRKASKRRHSRPNAMPSSARASNSCSPRRENGFGKRTSSYEYRVTGRGGSGIVALGMGKKNTAIIAAFPVEESDDLMLITNQGQTIRVARCGRQRARPRRAGRRAVPPR